MLFNFEAFVSVLNAISIATTSNPSTTTPKPVDDPFDHVMRELYESMSKMTFNSSEESKPFDIELLLEKIRGSKMTDEEFGNIYESLSFSSKEMIISRIPNVALPQRRERKPKPIKRKNDDQEDDFISKR
jgi:hypothetical protein